MYCPVPTHCTALFTADCTAHCNAHYIAHCTAHYIAHYTALHYPCSATYYYCTLPPQVSTAYFRSFLSRPIDQTKGTAIGKHRNNFTELIRHVAQNTTQTQKTKHNTDTEHRTQNKTQNTEQRTQHRKQNTKQRKQKTEHRTQNTTQNTQHRTQAKDTDMEHNTDTRDTTPRLAQTYQDSGGEAGEMRNCERVLGGPEVLDGTTKVLKPCYCLKMHYS